MVSDDALIAARVECLKAAVAWRTPGTSPDATTAIAAQLWGWVSFGVHLPEAYSDNPHACAGPVTAQKAARAAGPSGKAADRATTSRGNPSDP